MRMPQRCSHRWGGICWHFKHFWLPMLSPMWMAIARRWPHSIRSIKASRFFASLARGAEYQKPPLLRQGVIDGLPGFVTVKWSNILQTSTHSVEDDRIRSFTSYAIPTSFVT